MGDNTRAVYAFAFGTRAQSHPQSGAKLRDIFLEFANETLVRTGVAPQSIRYRNKLSNASRRKFGSTYTGCVHDISLGNLDLCLGDFWDTLERRSFGSASFIEVESQNMYLFGRKWDDGDE